MVRDTGYENLQILASGRVPPNPAELLGSEQMGKLLAALREVSDFVLIDGAPLLPVSDSVTLAPLVDAVLFVADAQNTHRSAVDYGMKQLQQINAPVLGAVLNNFDPSKASSYYHSYGYSPYRYQGTYLEEKPSAQAGAGRGAN